MVRMAMAGRIEDWVLSWRWLRCWLSAHPLVSERLLFCPQISEAFFWDQWWRMTLVIQKFKFNIIFVSHTERFKTTEIYSLICVRTAWLYSFRHDWWRNLSNLQLEQTVTVMPIHNKQWRECRGAVHKCSSQGIARGGEVYQEVHQHIARLKTWRIQ